jgi:hypothetical protein
MGNSTMTAWTFSLLLLNLAVLSVSAAVEEAVRHAKRNEGTKIFQATERDRKRERSLTVGLDTCQAAHAVRTHPAYYHFSPLQFYTHRCRRSSIALPFSPHKISYLLG